MSNWTHVAGIIRADGFRFVGSDPNFDEIVGISRRYGDNKIIGAKYMPAGSEGTLEKMVWVNPDKSSLAAYTISIFGDLRDHHSPQAIIDWFKDLCKQFMIRNACITVENEWNGTINWVYDSSNEIC